MATKYHIPIDTNPECFTSIGELVVRWGWIENQTTVLIRELLRIKRPAGDMAIGNMGIIPKTRVLRSLATLTLKKNNLGQEIAALADTIQKYDAFRNDVVHGLWVHAPRGTDNLALLMRKSLQQKIDPLPDCDITRKLPTKIDELKRIQIEAQRLTILLKSLRGHFD